MGYELTASQAKTVTNTDMVIYNEIDTLSRAIMAAALEGELDVTVDDGTTMTNTVRTLTLIGTEYTQDTALTDLVMTINGVNITFGDVDILYAVADVNRANIPGLTASVSADNTLQLDYAGPEASLVISYDVANTVGIPPSTYATTAATGIAYYNMWAGINEDRKKSYEFTQVVNHFQNLGYNILAKKNTVTENTLLWEIYW